MNKFELIVLFLCLCAMNLHIEARSKCPRSLAFTNEETVYTLSDDTTEATDAEDQCSPFNGKLTVLKNDTLRKKLVDSIAQKYNRDLQRIYVSKGTDPRNGRTAYRFATTRDPPPENAQDDEESGIISELEYFDLYTTSGEDRSELYFCHNERIKWLVQKTECLADEGWIFDMKLYTSIRQTSLEIFIFQAGTEGSDTSSRLTDVKTLGFGFDHYMSSFYSPKVPDIYFWVGAKFDVKSEKWVWSDGSDAEFLAPQRTECLRQALYYGDGKLTSKSCDYDPWYYSCQVGLKVTASPPKCKSRNILIKWSNDILKLAESLKVDLSINITVTLGSNTTKVIFNKIVPFSDLSISVGNLKPRTSYDIYATARFPACQNLAVATQTIVTTAFGIPGPVKRAYVKSNEPTCDITVVASRGDPHVASYQVKATSNGDEVTQDFNAKRQSFQFNTGKFDHNATILFEIKAASCEGASRAKKVEGHCKGPPIPTTLPPPTTKPPEPSWLEAFIEDYFFYLIGGGSGGLLLLVAAIVFVSVWCKKRRNSKEIESIIAASEASEEFGSWQARAEAEQQERERAIAEMAMKRNNLGAKTLGIKKMPPRRPRPNWKCFY